MISTVYILLVRTNVRSLFNSLTIVVDLNTLDLGRGMKFAPIWIQTFSNVKYVNIFLKFFSLKKKILQKLPVYNKSGT